MLEKIKTRASKLFSSLEKETSVLEKLHRECNAAVNRMDEAKPGFRAFIEKAYGYAVFPAVGKAAAVIGAAFGKGEVFEQGKLVGYAAVAQLTLGVQLGGETYAEVVVFDSKQALARFKRGRTAFAADASAVLIKAGAAAASNFEKGGAVFLHSEGGLMLEAAIGGQHFSFRPAFMGRARLAPTARKKPSAGKPGSGRSRRKTPPSARSSAQSSQRPGHSVQRERKARSRSRTRSSKGSIEA
jgi:lipid-binding SYLF domain-containing protein